MSAVDLDRVVEDQDTDIPSMIHRTFDTGTPAVSLCGTLLFGKVHSEGTPTDCVVCEEMAADWEAGL
jgi:hypothetical protein